jgi:hypothetical protein
MENCSMRPQCIPMFWPCQRQLCMCCTDSARFFRQCIALINFVPNVRFHIVRVADLRGFKDGTSRRCWRGVSQKGCTHTIELSHYFCSNTWPLYIRMLSACYNKYPTEYSAFVSRYEQKYFMNIMQIIAIIT